VSPFFRALLLMQFLGLALVGSSAAPGLAQEQNAGPAAGGQTPLAPPQARTSGSHEAPPLFDPTPRIKYLHDRLRISPEPEPLWDTVAQTIRDNARDIVPLLRERFRAKTSGSALDVLHSYEALGESQLDSLKKFISVEPLAKLQ
jgi:protein CpxP